MAWKAISESDLILISTEESAKTACTLYQNLTIVDLVPHLKLNSPKMAIIWSDSKHRDPAHQWFRNLFCNGDKIENVCYLFTLIQSVKVI